MLVNIAHPTGRENFSRVEVGPLTIWFSYSTPIAYNLPGEGTVVRRNEWGPTTGRHMNEIDGGSADRRAARIDGAEFVARLDRITAPLALVTA